MRLTGREDGAAVSANRFLSRLPGSLKLTLGALLLLALAFLIAARSSYHGLPVLHLVENHLRGWSAHPEHLQIGVKFEDLQRLAYVRDQALDKGILITSEKEFVPAAIQYGDREFKAKIRLKGDWVADNLEADKWSFRVVLKGDETLFGMKQFSLHQPKVRNYVYEWLFHQALKREDIIPLRTFFIRLSLNGKDLGIYAVEEHFDKRLIEYNSRREGVIVKFNEDVRWRDAREFWPSPSPTNLSAMEVAEIDAFQTGSVLADSTLHRQFLLAESLLEQFRTGQIKPGQVFDTPRMATYLALVDLMGGLHALSWHNLRFYFNPVTSLLEPIGFDAMAGTPIRCATGTTEYSGQEINSFLKRLFADDEFLRQYVAVSERLATPQYLDSLLDAVDDSLQAQLTIIYREYPYFDYSPDVFRENQRIMAGTLSPVRCLNAYVQKADDREIVLDLANIQALPVEVTGLSMGDRRLEPTGSDRILPPANPLHYREMSFATPPGVIWTDSVLGSLKVLHQIVGSAKPREIEVIPRPRMSRTLLSQDLMRREPNFETAELLLVNHADSTVVFKPGEWTVREGIIIPKGYRVIASGGTVINLLNSARILSHSPVFFEGTSVAPILIRSSDSTGQGLIVIDAGRESILTNVTFENLQRPREGAWDLTGAVTFYDSPVRIDSCVFRGIGAEDCLNVVRANLAMDHSLFANCSFDAFDGDFITGIVTDTHFRNCGNDGIDVSGSDVRLQGITVVHAGDKGISAGENSRVTGSAIDVSESNMGVAAKDLSTLRLSGVRISRCKVGCGAYQKKPEYGPASVFLDSLTISDAATEYVVEAGSQLTIDGVSVHAVSRQVYDSLYGNSGGSGLF